MLFDLLLQVPDGVKLDDHPVAVTQADTTSMYLLDAFGDLSQIKMFSVEGVLDAAAAVTSGIVALGTIGRKAGSFILAAVKPNAGGTFGDTGSGIALSIFGNVESTINSEKKTRRGLTQINAVTGVLSTGPAFPFNKTSNFLKIGSNLVAMTDVVDITFDWVLRRFYIALQVTGGAAGTDGAIAIAIGYVDTLNRMHFEPIAPVTTFAGTDKIIGAVGSSVSVSIQKVRTMWTTSRLNYLIVQGNVGAAGTTARSVFALPLINVDDDNVSINGTLAKKSDAPVDTYSRGTTARLIRRGFTLPVAATADLPLSTDAAALVGGGTLSVGDITDMFVQSDTVFVVVGSAVAGQLPGVFASQALFDQAGKIKKWTTWQRVAGTTNQIFGATIDPETTQFLLMSGTTIDTTQLINRTSWGMGETSGVLSMTDIVGSALGNQVCGFFDFPVLTPGLSDISLAVATGPKKVVLVQTGATVGGTFTPTFGDFSTNQKDFTNGTITETLPGANPPAVVTIAGGVLDTVGATTAADIGNDGTNGWLFVGGIGGVAVLSKADNSGWTIASQLTTNFGGLTSDMSFKTIGSYTFVRKIIADGTFLYILTDTKLDRIDLTVSGFTSVTTLATNDTFNADSMLDMVVSGKFAVVATTNGLFRVANGMDVSVSAIPSWVSVTVPECRKPVAQLFAISSTGRIQDVAKSGGGLLYALCAFGGKNRGQLNRFSIADISASAVTNTTLQALNDFFIKNDTFTNGVPSFFTSFGQFRTLFATDGTSYFNARNASCPEGPFLNVLPISARTGALFQGAQSLRVPIELGNASIISALVRNSATGSWMLAGDLGLRVNE